MNRQMRDNVIITDHAIDQFMKRSKCVSTIRAINRLKKMLKEGNEVEIKDPVKRTKALLNHDLKEAKYLRYDGWILVIEGRQLKTVHKGEAKIWVERKKQ